MFLYLGIGSLLVIMIGVVTFNLNTHYLLSSVDGLLKQRMVLMYEANQFTVPDELATRSVKSRAINPPSGSEIISNESDDSIKLEISADDDHVYGNDLAGIFILPLDKTGKQLFNPNPYAPPISPDSSAVQAAIQNGSDLRTIRSQDGISYRLLSFHLANVDPVAVVQMGKSLAEQEKLSSQFLVGLLLVGSLGVAALGLASWWLSGRALQPTMLAWDQQQVFIANAGHELRTPLTLIRSGMEVVQRSGLQPEQSAVIKDALAECDHMNKLVEDLLLLSRLDHQRLNFEFTTIDLKSLIEDVSRKMEPLAVRKEILIQTFIPSGQIKADAFRLRQVFLILLDNAIRNTDSGGRIEISALKKSVTWEIDVADNGVGIPENDLHHIFERFYRINRVSRKDYSGYGLGLSIARSIIEAHNGTIQITSKPGQGTRVTLKLPAIS